MDENARGIWSIAFLYSYLIVLYIRDSGISWTQRLHQRLRQERRTNVSSCWSVPREDAGGLSREYVLRVPGLSYKATKGAPLYSHGRWCGVKPNLTHPEEFDITETRRTGRWQNEDKKQNRQFDISTWEKGWNWMHNVTCNDISVIYETAHRYAGGIRRTLDLRSS